MNNCTAYEVIRIIDSKPLFALDHYYRLVSTLKSVNANIEFCLNTFFCEIKKIITQNNIVNGNVKIDIEVSSLSEQINIASKQIAHKYPNNEEYLNGVKTVTFKYERNSPQNKIWNQKLRDNVDNLIKSQSVYEVIYVDNENSITEGSRSNIFFINNNTLYSAPSEQILLGITRKYIIQTAELCGYEFETTKISLDKIDFFDAAFISGTSPKILPINQIDNIKFNVGNNFLRELMKKFDELVDDNISKFNFQ